MCIQVVLSEHYLYNLLQWADTSTVSTWMLIKSIWHWLPKLFLREISVLTACWLPADQAHVELAHSTFFVLTFLLFVKAATNPFYHSLINREPFIRLLYIGDALEVTMNTLPLYREAIEALMLFITPFWIWKLQCHQANIHFWILSILY